MKKKDIVVNGDEYRLFEYVPDDYTIANEVNTVLDNIRKCILYSMVERLKLSLWVYEAEEVNAFAKYDNGENYVALSVGLLKAFLDSSEDFISHDNFDEVFLLSEENKDTFTATLYYHMLISIVAHELGHISHGHLLVDTNKKVILYNSSADKHDKIRNQLIQQEEFDADCFGVYINYSSIFWGADASKEHDLLARTDMLFISTYLSYQVLAQKGKRNFKDYFEKDIFYYDHPHPGIRMWYSIIYIAYLLSKYDSRDKLLDNGIHGIIAYEARVLRYDDFTNSYYSVGSTKQGALHVQSLVNGWNSIVDSYRPHSYYDIEVLDNIVDPPYFIDETERNAWGIIMQDYSIKNTTKEQRIELIKSWQPEDESFDDNDLDIWEIYRDYIDGKKEIAECNAEFAKKTDYMAEN